MISREVGLIIDALNRVLPADRKPIGLHEPLFSGSEWNYVKECIDTGWVSSVGKYVDKFENDLAEFTGVKRAIAVVNGTAALHISLKLIDLRQNDEVIVPTLTFVATVNAVAYCGAIPHFADSAMNTLGLDPEKLNRHLSSNAIIKDGQCYNRNTGRRIKAVLPMHTFGHPVDLDPLLEICARYKLDLVEDCAESLGSYYKGKHTGHWGKVSAVSFNGNKVITTGGGGAILTNDEALGKLAKHLTTTAKVPHKWEFNHDMIGYNYRLPNINAALGCAQLEQLPRYLTKKREIANRYLQALSGISEVHFFTEPDFAKSNYWLNALLLTNSTEENRNNFLEATHSCGILTRPAWKLMHKLSMYAECPRMDLSTAEKIEASLINLPSSVFI